MKQLLDFDDAGASDDEPVKDVTVGDIRAWYDQYDNMNWFGGVSFKKKGAKGVWHDG